MDCAIYVKSFPLERENYVINLPVTRANVGQ
jgi:hypothetical protein